MTENYMVCNCKKVSLFDIADALKAHGKFDDVLEAFACHYVFSAHLAEHESVFDFHCIGVLL